MDFTSSHSPSFIIKSPTCKNLGSCSVAYGSCSQSGTNDFQPSFVRNGCSGVNSIPVSLIVYSDGSSPNDLHASPWEPTVCVWSIAVTVLDTISEPFHPKTSSPTIISSIF